MANMGLDDFNARVKRIKSPRNNSYFDQEMGMHVPKHTSQEEIRKNVKSQKSTISKILVSLIIGVVAVMGAQAVRLRYLEMVEASNGTLFTDLLLATLLVLSISAFMGHRRIPLRFAQVLGAAAMLVAGHNLMWAYPDQLAIVYTTEYVDLVRSQTEPMSLVFRDMAITISSPILDS